MDVRISGQCQCGALRYRCSAAPVFTANCWCVDCRRTSGGAFTSVVNVPTAALKITGELRHSHRVGASGQRVANAFCAACGSRMFSYPDVLGAQVNIMAGSLDDAEWYRPVMNIYAAQAAPWAEIDRSLLTFDTTPPITGAQH